MNERKQEIVDIIYKKGRVGVAELAEMLYVSEMTIRRDLTELERSGFVKRYRGGAVPKRDDGVMPVSERFFVEEEEKKLLAQRASKYLMDNISVYIDSSSTCQYLIPHMAKFSNIRMITNSVRALLTAAQYHLPCILIGGDYYERDMCLVGEMALERASEFNVDLAFYSVLGYDNGIMTDDDVKQCAVRRAIMKNADKNIVLIESGKVGNRYINTVAREEDMTEVIISD